MNEEHTWSNSKFFLLWTEDKIINLKEKTQNFVYKSLLKTAVSFFKRGLAKAYIKDYRGAIQDFTKSIEFHPRHAEAYCNRGLAKHLLGDKEGACLDWHKAGELGFWWAYDYIRDHCK